MQDVSGVGATATGRRRSNEDAFLVAGPVFIVADGMGGHIAGGQAARAVVDAFDSIATPAPDVPATVDDAVRCVGYAREGVHQVVAAYGGPSGSTLTGAIAVEVDGSPWWLVLNVGDSRVYALTGGAIEQITVDHSRVQELLDAGVITEAEVATHPERSAITRAIGDGGHGSDMWLVPMRPDRELLVVSDGLTKVFSDAQINDLLANAEDVAGRAHWLVEAAVANGARDNVTVVLAGSGQTITTPGAIDAAEVAAGGVPVWRGTAPSPSWVRNPPEAVDTEDRTQLARRLVDLEDQTLLAARGEDLEDQTLLAARGEDPEDQTLFAARVADPDDHTVLSSRIVEQDDMTSLVDGVDDPEDQTLLAARTEDPKDQTPLASRIEELDDQTQLDRRLEAEPADEELADHTVIADRAVMGDDFTVIAQRSLDEGDGTELIKGAGRDDDDQTFMAARGIDPDDHTRMAMRKPPQPLPDINSTLLAERTYEPEEAAKAAPLAPGPAKWMPDPPEVLTQQAAAASERYAEERGTSERALPRHVATGFVPPVPVESRAGVVDPAEREARRRNRRRRALVGLVASATAVGLASLALIGTALWFVFLV